MEKLTSKVKQELLINGIDAIELRYSCLSDIEKDEMAVLFRKDKQIDDNILFFGKKGNYYLCYDRVFNKFFFIKKLERADEIIFYAEKVIDFINDDLLDFDERAKARANGIIAILNTIELYRG